MKEIIKKYRYNLLSFFIPFLILCLVFLCLSILIPHGKSILISDLEIQYNPLLTYFKNHGFEIFSFQKGIGSSMLGTIAYYLASPFNLITFFFPNDKIDIAILFIIMLKISLSGLTMFLFLKNEIKIKDEKYLLIFSTSYALMSYHVAYFFNIMWLDATLILPIVILGINKLFKDKSTLYIFSLFYAIVTNYYMGYMICIFSLLYFIYKLLLCNEKKQIIHIIFKFVISSILAVGMSLFLLLPAVLELKQLSRNTINPYRNDIEFSNPIKVLSFIFMASRGEGTVLSKGMYSLYFGLIHWILIFFYFINTKISKKEKKLSFLMIFIFILSIFINYVDYVWHGFTATFSFPARYLFLFTFFNLILSARSFVKIQFIKLQYYLIFLIIFIFSSIAVMIYQFSYISNYILMINVVLVIFYLFLLYHLNKILEKKKILMILIVFLVFGELFFNFYMSIRTYRFFTRYEIEDIYHSYNKKLNKVKEKDFYRIEKNYTLTANDSFRYNIYSPSHFLSTIHDRTIAFLGYTNYLVDNNFTSFYRVSPVIDSILGNRYIFLKNVETNFYKKIDKMKVSETRNEYYKYFESPVYMYQNEYNFSLGNLVNSKTGKCKLNYKKTDRIQFQSNLVECLSGNQSDVFEKIELEKIDKNKYKFVTNGKRTVYIVPKINYNYNKGNHKIKIIVNNQLLCNYSENSVVITNFDVNYDTDSDMIIEIKNEENIDKEYELYAYYFNYDKYEEIFKDLSSEKMKILKNNNGYIKGEVEVKDNNKNYLFLNTEYTDEWEIKVDGKKVKYDEVFNTFVGVKLSKGKHTIEMKFHPKGFKLGVILSIISLVLTTFYLKKESKLNK